MFRVQRQRPGERRAGCGVLARRQARCRGRNAVRPRPVSASASAALNCEHLFIPFQATSNARTRLAPCRQVVGFRQQRPGQQRCGLLRMPFLTPVSPCTYSAGHHPPAQAQAAETLGRARQVHESVHRAILRRKVTTRLKSRRKFMASGLKASRGGRRSQPHGPGKRNGRVRGHEPADTGGTIRLEGTVALFWEGPRARGSTPAACKCAWPGSLPPRDYASWLPQTAGRPAVRGGAHARSPPSARTAADAAALVAAFTVAVPALVRQAIGCRRCLPIRRFQRLATCCRMLAGVIPTRRR